MIMFLFCLSTLFFFFSSRRRHTRCALVTGVQTCALPIWPVQALGDEAFLRRRIVEAVVVEVVVEVLGEGEAAGLAVQLPVLGDHRHRTAPAAGLGGLELRRKAATAIRTALGDMHRKEIAVTGQGANERHCHSSAAPSDASTGNMV